MQTTLLSYWQRSWANTICVRLQCVEGVGQRQSLCPTPVVLVGRKNANTTIVGNRTQTQGYRDIRDITRYLSEASQTLCVWLVKQENDMSRGSKRIGSPLVVRLDKFVPVQFV